MKHHKLKLDMNFCDDVLSGRKNFEVRYNDRGYQAGDTVSFIPYVGMLRSHHEVEDKKYQITYVLNGWGLKNNYVVFGIKPYREDGNNA